MKLLVIFIIFFLVSRHVALSKKSNMRRHLSAEYDYAHFSKIDRKNYFLFPELLLTSPQRYTLETGQSIYIPPNWWHWVRTDANTFAVNFWADETRERREPFKFESENSHTHKSIVQKMKEKVNTPEEHIKWNHDTDIMKRSDSGYVITLPGYKTIDAQMNSDLVDCVDESIKPSMLVNPEVNAWISMENRHDTGLHYDDKHGVLTVLSGRKHVTLFPPADTKYLHPHDMKPWWTTVEPRKIEYNAYRAVSHLPDTSHPSSRLLYESLHTAEHRDRIIRHINRCKRDTVWGCKQMYDSPTIRWEMYEYHYDLYSNAFIEQRKIIDSKDYYDTQDVIGPETHEYYRITELARPFMGFGTRNENEKESVFVLDESNRFKENAKEYMKEIGFDKFPGDLFNKYECKDLVCWNKFDGNYFIQFLGISVENFIDFLSTHNYPSHLVEHVSGAKEKYRDITHEITIVYDKNGKVVRSGFYGIL